MFPITTQSLSLLALAVVLVTSQGERAVVTASGVGVSQAGKGTGTLDRATLEKLEQVIAKLFADPKFDRLEVLQLLLNVSGGFNRIGEFDKGEKYGREALAIARNEKLRLQEAIALNRLGLAQRGRGDHREALENFESALAIVDSLDRAGADIGGHRADLLNNLGLLQMEFDRPAAASANFNKANALTRELLAKAQGQRALVLKESLARGLLNAANAFYSLNETTLALKAAAEARQTSREIPDPVGEGDVLHFLGHLLNNRGEYAAAEAVLKEALEIQRKLGDRTGQARALNALGFAYSRTNRSVEAEQMYRDALKLQERGGRSRLDIRLNLATVLVAQGRTAEADTAYSETLALLNARLQAQAKFLSEAEQLAFLETVAYASELYLSFCLAQSSTNPAFAERMYDTLLRHKGLVVLSEAARRSRIAAAGSEAQALLQQLSAARQRLSVTARSGAASGNATQITELEERVVTLERTLAARIEGSDASAGQEITWREVRQRLRPDDAAVEFARFRLHNGIRFTGETRYIALVLTSRHARPQLIDLGSAKEIEAALEDLRSLTGATHAQYASPDAGRLSAATLWRSLESAMPGARRVFLSPDGELHKVSWSVLRVRGDEPLIASHDIRVVLSTKDLLRTARAATGGSVVLLGNPAFTLPSDASAVRPTPAAVNERSGAPGERGSQ